MRQQTASVRGQTLVEFALILPIFILLLVGIFDVGRAVYAYNTINNAAREAVRVGIVNQNTGAIEAKAIKQAVSLGLAATDIEVRFLQPDYSNAAPCNATPRTGCLVEVEVRYQYTAATPVIGNLVGVLDLQGSSRQPIERTFNAP
ncbi:MAG: pilus assembly protein [Actinobacteria bacterium]|nr:pilus assembly protein [Actinomycetota bacterium]